MRAGNIHLQRDISDVEEMRLVIRLIFIIIIIRS